MAALRRPITGPVIRGDYPPGKDRTMARHLSRETRKKLRDQVDENNQSVEVETEPEVEVTETTEVETRPAKKTTTKKAAKK